MISMSNTSKEFKIILHHKFNITNAALIRSLSVLEEKNLDGSSRCKMEFQNKIQKLNESIKLICEHYQKEVETKQSSTQQTLSVLSARFLLYKQTELEGNYLSDITKLYIENYQSLYDIFRKNVFIKYLNICSKNIVIDPELMALIEWLDFGLENLSNYLYPCMNSMIDVVVNIVNPQQLSLWQKCKQTFASTFISKAGVYDTVINTVFNIDEFCHILNKYNTQCHIIQFSFKTKTFDMLEEEALSATQEKASFIDVVSPSKIELNKVVGLNSDIKTLGNDSERVFIESFFYEIKEFVVMMEELIDKDALITIKQVLSLVKDFLDNVSEVSHFALNECYNWLSVLDKESSVAVVKCLIPLIQSYLKVINGFRLTYITFPNISNSEWIQEHFKVLFIQANLRLLTTITLKRQRFLNCLIQNQMIAYITPHFSGFHHLGSNVNGGSQQKALGTGFYSEIHSENTMFIKRTTNFFLLVDDFSELLASSLSRNLGTLSFAVCQPIIASTNDVYIASECSKGFSPLMDMKGRFTTRLLPFERKSLFTNLAEDDLNQLRNILIICTLLADTDPNPGNIGLTNSNGIKKIDHGWAFDQICKPFIATWHDPLNPLRYPGRIAPTNALCDYKLIFKVYDLSLIQNIAKTVNSKSILVSFILNELEKITSIYLNSRATGSLKDKIEYNDIIKLFCQRFGLIYQPQIDLDYISKKLSKSIYIRSQNLYLICILENTKHANNEMHPVLLNLLKEQLEFMLERKIVVYNLSLIKKYAHYVKLITIDEDLSYLLDNICGKFSGEVISECKLSDDTTGSSAQSPNILSNFISKRDRVFEQTKEYTGRFQKKMRAR